MVTMRLLRDSILQTKCKTCLCSATRAAVLVLCLLASSTQLLAADEESPRVYWDAETRITWDYFQAAIPPFHPSTENSAINTGIEWSCKYAMRRSSDEQTYSLCVVPDDLVAVAWMNPENSWVDRTVVTANSLEYMRLQFDLQHVYAQRLQIDLLAIEEKITATNQANTIVQSVAQPILDACREATRRCGVETQLGSSPKELSEWIAAVSSWLETPRLAPLSWESG